MDDHERRGISEQDLAAIRKMRAFRRRLSIIVAVLILLAAILLALLSGLREEAKRAVKAAYPGMSPYGIMSSGVLRSNSGVSSSPCGSHEDIPVAPT